MPSRVCAFCERHSQMTPLAEPHETDNGHRAGAFACGYCKEINVAVYTGGRTGSSWAATFHTMDDALTWFPLAVSAKQYPDVPEHAAGAASEAHQAHSILAYRAAVLLARSVIEATAKDRGNERGNLHDKIEALHTKGLLRAHVRDAAHEVRHLGNDLAHGDFVLPVDAVEADEILTLMDEVLDEVYQSPARVKNRKDARLAKKAAAP